MTRLYDGLFFPIVVYLIEMASQTRNNLGRDLNFFHQKLIGLLLFALVGFSCEWFSSPSEK